ncbi:hypothetical protein ACEV7Z_23495, partial [Vibrio parahaemolyticus]
DQKKSFGQILNDFKLFAEARFEELEASLGNTHPETRNSQTDVTLSSSKGRNPNLDYSLPGEPIPVGTRHPLSLVR